MLKYNAYMPAVKHNAPNDNDNDNEDYLFNIIIIRQYYYI